MTQDRNRSRYLRSVTSRQRDYSESPDAIVMSVTDIHASGRYLCKKDHWPTAILVPVRPMGARLPYPGRHTVYFEDGDRGRPFLLWTRPEREAWPVLSEDFNGLWVRLEARRYGRFWLGDPETPVVTAGEVTPVEDRPVQGPLRSYGEFLTWAADSTLTEYEPATGASTETEHTGPIVAVWDDGETWVLTQVDTTPAGYDEGYSDGYAATEGTGSGSPYNEGANACINETPYDPSGSNPGPPEVEGTEEYIDGYNAGWGAGWQINYDAGYEGAGCTIPEE